MAKKNGPKKAKKASIKRSVKKQVVRRGKSKLTLIQDPDAAKDQSPEAFRPDKTIKQFLANLPRGEKSNFIVEAIYEKIANSEQVTCPLCNGHGKLGSNVKVVKP